MSAVLKSMVLVLVAIIWLVLKSSLTGIYHVRHWLKHELDIEVTGLELLKASAFFLSCLPIIGLVLAALQN